MPLTYSDIRDELSSAIYGDYRATLLWTRLHEKGSGYKDAYAYAIRVGTVTGNVLRKYEPEDLADWDLENLIPGTLGLNHNMVVAACREAQRNLNALANIGILPQLPDFDGNRAFGLVEAVRKRGKIGPSFYDQVTNFDLNVVDQSVRKNAELQSRAGLNPKIVRTAASKCCEWCDKLAGTYDYYKISNTGNPVWRRHDNCRCTIEYDPGQKGGKRKIVSGSRSTDSRKADRIQLAKIGKRETVQLASPEITNLLDELVAKSVGAKSQNYEIMDLLTREIFHLAEGSRLHDKKVFAGKGSNTIYRDAWKYADRFGGREEDWQHVKAIGEIDFHGEIREAEIHWSQHEDKGKHDFFIKEWRD